ncbi:MAG TPA: copper resistance protein NlpE N-terminal domain-containing protein [Lysobacter sp.]|nr:copper resistance protein NlpE N-terminal domain-containing protein [Lysobacter sp.]
MKSTSTALACLVLIMLAGCQPEAAEPVAAIDSPAVAPVTQVAVANAVPSDRVSTFDQRGFAGTFSGTVGDADTTLALAPDGTAVLTESRAGAGGATISGTWTTEAKDQHLRLDPDSKGEPDRLFAIAANDRISALGSDGEPVPGGDLARQ